MAKPKRILLIFTFFFNKSHVFATHILIVGTYHYKLGMNRWVRTKTETSGGSASEHYVPCGMKGIGEVRQLSLATSS